MSFSELGEGTGMMGPLVHQATPIVGQGPDPGRGRPALGLVAVAIPPILILEAGPDLIRSLTRSLLAQVPDHLPQPHWEGEHPSPQSLLHPLLSQLKPVLAVATRNLVRDLTPEITRIRVRCPHTLHTAPPTREPG